MRVAPAIELSSEVRLELEKLSRRRTTPVRVVQRSRIVLLAADGMQNKQIAEQLGRGAAYGGPLAEPVSSAWRRRSDEGCSAAGTDAGDFCQRGSPKSLPGRRSRSRTEPRTGRAAGWRARWAFPTPAWAASGARTA